jgi:cysteine desulfurase family protein (TIGR01976 family)
MTDFDVVALRREFPALGLEQDGRPLAFFDGPGGTQVPQRVIDAVVGYYRTSNANDGGAFVTSQRSDAIVAEAHAALADLLNAASAEEIKFGYNMTTLTFHVSRSIGATLEPGDELIVTTLDHEANVSPWRAMAADRGLTVRTVDIRPEDGTLDLDDLRAKLSARTRLVAFGYASNAIGTINPVADIVRLAHEAGALTYVDAVHFAPHGPIDVQALDTDFLACSAYKFFGPHLGVLYGKADVLERLPAYKVRPAHDRFETGTQNFEGIAGALGAVEYIASVGDRFGAGPAAEFAGMTGRRLLAHTGMRAIRAYETALFERLLHGLARIDAIRLWGIADLGRLSERTPTAALTLDICSPRQAAEALGRRGMTAWDGDFYARGLIERLGLAPTGGVLRIGLTHYNTADEVDRLLAALAEIAAGSAVGGRAVGPPGGDAR